ncbi:MAG: hypothetical protein JKY02_00680 [Flavobacteriaceae bacterium]|nr:hypothetical protein [Flavobacteriaceae bacterium]
MKIIKNYLTFFMLLSILTLFSSCIGQEKTTLQTETKQNSIISNVTELDPKAAVIYQDKKDNFWFASEEKGVYRYDGKNVVLFTSNDGLSSYRILSVQEDNFGNLYFDTPEGVYQYDGQKFTT